jgi:ribosome-associated protein
VENPNGPQRILNITAHVYIPLADVGYRFARSSGPGGQHTNKTETAVELMFDLAHTPYLSEAQRALAMQRLTSFLDQTGVLHLVSQSERSQLRNREEVTERFVHLLRAALQPVKPRRATKPSRAAHERRLTQKHRVGRHKANRQRPERED